MKYEQNSGQMKEEEGGKKYVYRMARRVWKPGKQDEGHLIPALLLLF
jgi:hypothetical protein